VLGRKLEPRKPKDPSPNIVAPRKRTAPSTLGNKSFFRISMRLTYTSTLKPPPNPNDRVTIIASQGVDTAKGLQGFPYSYDNLMYFFNIRDINHTEARIAGL
jgi:hypothetical protein